MGIIKDPKSWRAGFELGLAGFSFPYSKPRKPTVYLYNGIRLPALLEWDREKYPYAVIVYTIWPETPYYLYIDDSLDLIGRTSSLGKMVNNPDLFGTGFSSTFVYMTDSDSWVEKVESTPNADAIWTNYDLYYPENHYEHPGELCMTASEPIPVYE